MQFTLQFQVDKLTIPVGYKYQLQSMIYALMREKPRYSEFLHDKGYMEQGRGFRLFCLSGLNGTCRFHREAKKLTFYDSVSFELRTPVSELAELFRIQLYPGRIMKLFHQELVLESVLCSQKRLKERSYEIEMVSPILAYRSYESGTLYYNPSQEKFIVQTENNFLAKYKAYTGKEAEPITLTPLSVEPKDKKVLYYKDCIYTAWGGRYRLEGSPDALTFLYDAGLGARNAAGFGMFEVVQ